MENGSARCFYKNVLSLKIKITSLFYFVFGNTPARPSHWSKRGKESAKPLEAVPNGFTHLPLPLPLHPCSLHLRFPGAL